MNTCGTCHYFEGCEGDLDGGCAHAAIPRIVTGFAEEACDRWAEIGSVPIERATIHELLPISRRSAVVEDRARQNRIKQAVEARNKDLTALRELIKPIEERERARCWNYRDWTGDR